MLKKNEIEKKNNENYSELNKKENNKTEEIKSTTQNEIENENKKIEAAKLLEIFHSIFSIVIYCSCSISLILLNKSLMYTYKAKFSFFTLFLQNLTGVVFILFGIYFKFIKFDIFDFKVLKRWLILTVLFTTMIETSLLTLGLVSVPIFTAIKSTATVGTSFGEYYFFKTPLTKGNFLKKKKIFKNKIIKKIK
jgi:hypothetical protein